MTRLQRILIGAHRDLEQWRSTPRLTPPGDRRRMAAHNKRCDLAERGIVVCDVAQWLGEPQTRGNRVSNSRIYKDLACKNLAHPAAEGRRRQRTVALALTSDGIDLARQLMATANTTPAELADAPPATDATAAEPKPTSDPRDAAIFAALADATTPTADVTRTAGDAVPAAELADDATPVEPIACAVTPPIAETPAPTKPHCKMSDDEALLFILTHESDTPPHAVAVDADFPVSGRHLARLSERGLVRIKNHDGGLTVETTANGADRVATSLRPKATPVERIAAAAELAADQPPETTPATSLAPTANPGVTNLSRQANYERRSAAELAEADHAAWIENPAPFAATSTPEPAIVASPLPEPIATPAYRSVFAERNLS